MIGLPKRIEKKQARTNIKSMRRRNMFKKAIELHAMCDLDILIVTRDKELNRLMVYNSSPGAYFDDLQVN